MNRFLNRWYWRTIERDCWRAVNILIWMGQDNATVQEHIDAAKDSLYKAASAAIKERKTS